MESISTAWRTIEQDELGRDRVGFTRAARLWRNAREQFIPFLDYDLDRTHTVGHAVEASTERFRHHLRRPVPVRRDLLKNAGNTNLLDWWRRSGSAAMIFEAVVGVARETPVALVG
jgi:hypothetical protein